MMTLHHIQRRRTQCGVTLFEVLIVVAIIALVSGGVAAGVLPHWVKAQTRTTATNARAIRAAVKTWWMDHDVGTCPDVGQLIADGALDRDSSRNDAWNSPWQIQCEKQEITVRSNGPDRQPDTADDIRVPPG